MNDTQNTHPTGEATSRRIEADDAGLKRFLANTSTKRKSAK